MCRKPTSLGIFHIPKDKKKTTKNMKQMEGGKAEKNPELKTITKHRMKKFQMVKGEVIYKSCIWST